MLSLYFLLQATHSPLHPTLILLRSLQPPHHFHPFTRLLSACPMAFAFHTRTSPPHHFFVSFIIHKSLSVEFITLHYTRMVMVLQVSLIKKFNETGECNKTIYYLHPHAPATIRSLSYLTWMVLATSSPYLKP